MQECYRILKKKKKKKVWVYFLSRNIGSHQQGVDCLTSLHRPFLCFVCDYLKRFTDTDGHTDITPCYHTLTVATVSETLGNNGEQHKYSWSTTILSMGCKLQNANFN